MAAFRAAQMLTQEQAVEIKVLERQGRTIRQIMRETGLSRNTVRKYLRQPTDLRYGPRAARPCKLDPFKPYLLERIEQARPDWIPATVLLREIRAEGYVGGISQLKAYVRPFKVVRADPVVRFETEPGLQMQADFTIIRRGRDRLLAFVATLGFSRATFVRFTRAEQFEDWRDGLIAALEFFGGVPRQVLFDNTKTVIIKRDAYGPELHRWHPGMLELAREYGFQLRVCKPYRARTKGKVERFNHYLKRSFLIPLNATLRAAGLKLDVDTANREVMRWLNEVANTRLHATTGEQPCVRLPADQAQFIALPLRASADAPAISHATVIPFESLQHPLSVYDALLGSAA
jgi:transposase